MRLTVQTDSCSGFCGGVIRAISKAEDFLNGNGGTLYCLGSIVHNEAELERLGRKGLVSIGREQFAELKGADVIIRAHGEPPMTYTSAAENKINLIDCTCPVVLKLQRRIREAYSRMSLSGGQILIFGKVGHAEVLGLVGQVNGDAIVVENTDMLLSALESGEIRTDAPLEVFSQTTKSPTGYEALCEVLKQRMTAELSIHDTICSQVASRHNQLSDFAAGHDVIVFVSGRESSNGKVLFDLCKAVNQNSHQIVSEDEIDASWFSDGDKVGVCGATSTPKWLLEVVAKKILQLN